MIFEKLKHKIKSKKGAGAIEFTINMLIFVMIISIGFELIMIGYKYLQVSDYANTIVRTISIQGGIQKTVPAGFQGGADGYKTYATLLKEKADFAKSIGAKNSDVVVKITYKNSSGTTVTSNITSEATIKIDYLDSFEVTVDYTPKLEVADNFGAKLDNILRKTKKGLSEYVHNYDA